ncbi:MAG: DUF2147 domain-containing protein [Chitinophagaceae bacterium]|nr:DUF2147 domain-containing protein [Chitinophagaceae bacterium]
MKKTIKAVVLMLISISGMITGLSAQTSGDAILGKWTNEDKTRVIEFVKAGSGYEAIIKEAPDKSLIGVKQLTGLEYDGAGYKGQVHLPKKGKSYNCSLKVKADGLLELTAKAGIMSKSQLWKKVN